MEDSFTLRSMFPLFTLTFWASSSPRALQTALPYKSGVINTNVPLFMEFTQEEIVTAHVGSQTCHEELRAFFSRSA
jgi:hypothetical protein